ncbi:MAG: PEP-CTERM sorting domain-containing protein [Phycisphaerae bacterium]|nr:PEP-CTERM sorting domain-containing protein [Phycisphaerae bacterium]
MRRVITWTTLVFIGILGSAASGTTIYSNSFDTLADLSAAGTTSYESLAAPGGKAGNALHMFGEGDGVILTLPTTSYNSGTMVFRFYVADDAANFLGAYRYGPGEGFKLKPGGTVTDSNDASISSFVKDTWYTVALYQRSYGPMDMYLAQGVDAELTESDYIGSVSVYPSPKLESCLFFNHGGSGDWYVDDFTVNEGFDLTAIPEPATMVLLAAGGLGVVFRRRSRQA